MDFMLTTLTFQIYSNTLKAYFITGAGSKLHEDKIARGEKIARRDKIARRQNSFNLNLKIVQA